MKYKVHCTNAEKVLTFIRGMQMAAEVLGFDTDQIKISGEFPESGIFFLFTGNRTLIEQIKRECKYTKVIEME